MPRTTRLTSTGATRLTSTGAQRQATQSGRDITDTLADAVRAGHVLPFIALEMLFDSPNELRLWSGAGDLSLNGETYLGASGLLQIGEVEETADLKASGLRCRLSGISPTIKSLVLAEPYSGRRANLYFGALNTQTEAVIASTQVFSGLMDQMSYDPSGDEAVDVSLTIEHELVILERSNERRQTDEDQQERFPGDTFFSFKSAAANRNIVWR